MLFFLVLAVLPAAAGLSGCADRRRIAVLGLEAEGCAPAECAWIEKALVEALSAKRPVVAPYSVRQRLGEGCQAAACNSETARALGVADVISGRLSRREASLKLSLERYRSSDGSVTRKILHAETAELLGETVRREIAPFISTR